MLIARCSGRCLLVLPCGLVVSRRWLLTVSTPLLIPARVLRAGHGHLCGLLVWAARHLWVGARILRCRLVRTVLVADGVLLSRLRTWRATTERWWPGGDLARVVAHAKAL